MSPIPTPPQKWHVRWFTANIDRARPALSRSEKKTFVETA